MHLLEHFYLTTSDTEVRHHIYAFVMNFIATHLTKETLKAYALAYITIRKNKKCLSNLKTDKHYVMILSKYT